MTSLPRTKRARDLPLAWLSAYEHKTRLMGIWFHKSEISSQSSSKPPADHARVVDSGEHEISDLAKTHPWG